MKKFIVCCLLLSIAVPACVHKKGDHKGIDKTKTHVKDANIGQTPTYDEEVGAFVLEDDVDHDLFDQAADAQKKTKTAKQAKTESVSPQGDLDDSWAWQELDEEQPTEVIHFDYDHADVRKDQEQLVRYDARLAKLACEDGATIVIEGHSCLKTRSQIYNQALSQRRADTVKREFVRLGVPAKCLKAVGRGTSMVITRAEGKQAQAPNRRVEVKFIYAQPAAKAHKKHAKPDKVVTAHKTVKKDAKK